MTQLEICPKSSLSTAKPSFLQKVTAITASDAINFLRKHRRTLSWVLLVALLLPPARFWFFLEVPPGKGGRVELVELGRGQSLRNLAAGLEARGIISSARLFTLYARIKRGDSKVKAGVYQFSDGMRPTEILAKMVAGDYYARYFAVPEGYSTYQLAEMLEKRGIFKKESFLDACHDPNLLAGAGIKAKSAEGYLAPGSYNILPGRSARDVVREMVLRQLDVVNAELKQNGGRQGLSVSQVLTLSSIVEKEAVLPAEKPLIAAVFENRLKKGMRLQSDPTAIYGLRAFGGKVSRHDILRPTPYNTYLIPGLPPGPIGNPGRDAIHAVLNPPAVPYLFFVARGDGSHQFSSDLAAHNQAVQRYLRSPEGAEKR